MATKKTSCLILKRDCFEVLAVSFQKSIKSFLLQLFPFLLLLSLSSSLLFFLFSYYLFDLVSIQVLFYLGYHMIFWLGIILLFFCLFFFRLFISHFKFIFVPFSSFISLFAIFLSFCASNESIVFLICMSLFSVLSLLAFCKSSEKNDKTVQTTEKTQVPFAFAVVLLQVLSWTIDSISLHPPIPVILKAIQPLAQSPLIHPSRETWEGGCPVTLARFCDTRISTLSLNASFTC